MSDNPECRKFVYWWNGEYEGFCELPKGHEGNHYDGLSWYNDNNELVSEPSCADIARALFNPFPMTINSGGVYQTVFCRSLPNKPSDTITIQSSTGATWKCTVRREPS